MAKCQNKSRPNNKKSLELLLKKTVNNGNFINRYIIFFFRFFFEKKREREIDCKVYDFCTLSCNLCPKKEKPE